MATQNNIRIPDDLLAELVAAAPSEGQTPDALAAQAIRRFLERKALDELIARGRIAAERAGNPDPVQAVRDIRRGI